MISKLLILSIFVLTFFGITVEPSLTYPTTCPTNDSQIVKAAILACQNDNYTRTASCMQEYIRMNYNGQYWSAMIKNHDDVPDFVSIWSVTSCIVKLDNFGNTYKRTYLAWSIRNYLNSTETIGKKNTDDLGNFLMRLSSGSDIDNIQFSNNRSANFHLTTNPPSNLRDDCAQWKMDTVKNIFQYCDVASNQIAAECIKQKIYYELDEYWGVYASTGTNSGLSVSFTYCGKVFRGYGLYSRTILVWSGF